MRKIFSLFPCSVLLLIAFSMLACGSSNRLQSIRISPATASSHAQFTATGTYADGSKVVPLDALWSQNSPWVKNQIADEISVDANGMASCLTAGRHVFDPSHRAGRSARSLVADGAPPLNRSTERRN